MTSQTSDRPATKPAPDTGDHDRAADDALVAAVRTAFDLEYWSPVPEIGETATRVCMWSVRELQDLFARTGGTVTAQQVEHTLSDGDTYTVTEVTVTTVLTGIGTVGAYTDWDPADEAYATDLPVIRAIAAAAAAA